MAVALSPRPPPGPARTDPEKRLERGRRLVRIGGGRDLAAATAVTAPRAPALGGGVGVGGGRHFRLGHSRPAVLRRAAARCIAAHRRRLRLRGRLAGGRVRCRVAPTSACARLLLQIRLRLCSRRGARCELRLRTRVRLRARLLLGRRLIEPRTGRSRLLRRGGALRLTPAAASGGRALRRPRRQPVPVRACTAASTRACAPLPMLRPPRPSPPARAPPPPSPSLRCRRRRRRRRRCAPKGQMKLR